MGESLDRSSREDSMGFDASSAIEHPGCAKQVSLPALNLMRVAIWYPIFF
jgi:hypothetical protein